MSFRQAHEGRAAVSNKANPIQQSRGVVMQDKCLHIVDADSGWENDEDIMWHIDEANAADWAEEVVMHLDNR